MNDSYQAIFDAVRSRIHNGDIGESVRQSLGNVDVHHIVQCAMQQIAQDWTLPHVVMRPRISIDGDKWGVLYGDNLQDGVAGFGDSPSEAMADFDYHWWKKLGEESKP